MNRRSFFASWFALLPLTAAPKQEQITVSLAGDSFTAEMIQKELIPLLNEAGQADLIGRAERTAKKLTDEYSNWKR